MTNSFNFMNNSLEQLKKKIDPGTPTQAQMGGWEKPDIRDWLTPLIWISSLSQNCFNFINNSIN